MSNKRRVILSLAACQALLLTNNIVNIAMNGLAGFDFATDKRWATLPLSAYTLATAVGVFPAALWMQRRGRRSGFVLGCVMGLMGSLVCAASAVTHSFGLLVLGNAITGGYNAFGQYYRFAAAESVDPPGKARAVALVVAGGLAGAFIGPEASKLSRGALSATYLGTYLFLACCAVVAAILAGTVQLRRAAATAHDAGPVRPLHEILRQPAVPFAIMAGALGYAAMNFLMTSTPLAMAAHHHAYPDSAFVIEWHAVAMFAPSLVLGPVIARFGTRSVIVAGALLGLLSVAVTQFGTSVPVFWTALVLLGLSWSLMYVAGTTALTETYRPSERFKVQGLNDTVVFACSATASALSGLLLQRTGWPEMAWATLLPLIAVLAASVFTRRRDPMNFILRRHP
jgi:MFS family permease